MSGLVSVTHEGPVAVFSLANPPMNYISSTMLGELYSELLRVRQDPSVRVLVLTGGMKGSFLTHFDIQDSLGHSKQVRKRSPRVTRWLSRMTYWLCRKADSWRWLDRLIIRSLAGKPPAELGAYYWVRCLDILDNLTKPVIAAINGLCLGGGCELSLCCDIRYMARKPEYRIGLPEVLVGILPGGTGTTCRLPRIVGEATALELIMTGKMCTADEAQAMGLIHAALDPEQLIPQALSLAHRMSRASPIAMAEIRNSVRQGNRVSYRQARVMDLAAIQAAMASEDARAGLSWYAQEILARYDRLDPEDLVRRLDAIAAAGGADVEFGGH
ncbi:MAG: enoyl-CoA hydratase/isomerase family protein [Deltaproteobacteria bacterium]|nr:enoyl-CoA hydratase/isomerase family protein [Deltaproteobacteria bacterium]